VEGPKWGPPAKILIPFPHPGHVSPRFTGPGSPPSSFPFLNILPTGLSPGPAAFPGYGLFAGLFCSSSSLNRRRFPVQLGYPKPHFSARPKFSCPHFFLIGISFPGKPHLWVVLDPVFAGSEKTFLPVFWLPSNSFSRQFFLCSPTLSTFFLFPPLRPDFYSVSPAICVGPQLPPPLSPGGVGKKALVIGASRPLALTILCLWFPSGSWGHCLSPLGNGRTFGQCGRLHPIFPFGDHSLFSFCFD